MRTLSRPIVQFAVASLLGLVLIGALVASYSHRVAADQLEQLGMIQHATLARTLSASLRSYIVPVVGADPNLDPQALRDDPAVVDLRRYLVEPLHGMKVVRIKIYDAGGRTVFSTEASQIGDVNASNEAYRAAMRGEVVAEMTRKNSFNASDGVIEDRDLLETYVPIHDGPDGPVSGVFELYTDMTDLLEASRRAQEQVVLGALLISSAAFMVLLMLFRRVDSGLQREQRAAARYLREVQDARENLEHKVDERTRELAVSERRFQDVADAAGEYIWETDPDGRFTFVSDRVESVLGYSPAELIGRAPLELAPEEDRRRVRRYFSDNGGDASFTGLEHRSRTHDGQVIWLSVSAVPVRDETGAFRGHRGAAHDITARKEAQATLRKMSLAIEQSTEIVIITDTQGVIEYVNPAFTTTFGYRLDEVVGETPRVLRGEEMPDEVYRELWETIRIGDTWRGELHNRARDGSMYWNLVSIFPLRGEKGEITHYVGLQTDITRRKHSEQALVASEARLRAITDSVADAIITATPAGIIEMVNPAAEVLFGYQPGELIGKDLRVLMPSPYREEHEGYMAHYMSTGRPQIIGLGRREVTGLRKDGAALPLELAVGEVRTGTGRLFVGVLRDLTDVKRAQRDLERTRQQYFHREKIAAMGQLAAGIVHEVGNPAAAISGAVGALRQRVAADPSRADEVVMQNLALIAEQSDRIAAMTREISDFARPREVRRSLLDLNQVVRSAVSIMRFDPRVQNAKLEVKLDPELPALVASQDQLTQVVLNLVLNAADACEARPDGGGHIDVATVRDGGHAVLTVRDDGIGMDEDTMRHAPHPYFTTKGEDRGMGLGLALCNDVVEEHGGEMAIESQPGAGTVVRVALPLAAEA